MSFPPLPAWDGLHPLVVHFPIALLAVAATDAGIIPAADERRDHDDDD